MSKDVPADYFSVKSSQDRMRVSDVSGKAFGAIEIARQVLRLCYPLRQIAAVHCYYNNSPMEPFVGAEHPDLPVHQEGFEKLTKPPKEYIVVDIYFLFDDQFGSKNEDEAFAVEVAYPVDVSRVRWRSIARVRWEDLCWKMMGSVQGGVPVPRLYGETFVNLWM